ncbi:MAG TPA: DUF3011 domain-containing protein [Gemmatimonadales bacterium]|nr:DUF3011 domain-containing protein [Gemmatimonadales bacterium]
MKNRVWIIAAAACLLVPPLAAQSSSAGMRSSSSRVIECGTGSTQRVHCDAGGQVSRARLIRDLSGNRCSAAGTWGWSGSAVWTDNTCRGQFEVDYATQPPTGNTGSATDSTRRITCGVVTVHQVRCSTEGPAASVRLVDEAAFARCRQGSNWGYSDSVIWAGNGCRAEFEVTYRNPSGVTTQPGTPTSTPTSITRTVTCGSTTSAQARCNVGEEATSVRLARDLSGTRCREGYSWGRTGTVIWTNRGCRAEFAVTYRQSTSPEPSPATPARPPTTTPARPPTMTPSGTRVIICGDTRGSAMSCNTFGTVATVRLQRDRSSGRCDPSSSWGLSGQSVWVTRGCYGDFELTYVAPAKQDRGIR